MKDIILIFMDKLNKEFKKFVEKIIGEDLNDNDIDISPKKVSSNQLYLFFKSFNDYLDLSFDLGKEIMQKLSQDASIVDLIETIKEIGLKKLEENPEMIELIQNNIESIMDILFSVDFHKEIFTIHSEDTFEQGFKELFLQELENAEKKSKNVIVKLWANIIRKKLQK